VGLAAGGIMHDTKKDGWPSHDGLIVMDEMKASIGIRAMARSVTLSTPIPTLEEFGKSLGLSKSRQSSLLRIVKRDASTGRFVAERHRESGTIREKSKLFRTKK